MINRVLFEYYLIVNSLTPNILKHSIFALSISQMRRLILFIVLVGLFTASYCQPENPFAKVPRMRQIFHDNIRKAQDDIIHYHSNKDSAFRATDNPDVNYQLTQILNSRILALQLKVENDSSFTEADKYKWLRSINEILTEFLNAYRYNNIKGIMLSDLIIGFNEAMQLELKGKSLAPLIDKYDWQVDAILTRNFALKNSFSTEEATNAIVLKMCQTFPENIINIVQQHPEIPNADSLIAEYTHRNPENIYNYASSPNAIGKLIRKNKDSLIQLICKMANMNTGRSYFPFLDDLFHNKISFDSITKVLDSEDDYYKLLVSTEISYAGRIANGDVPLVMNILTQKLKAKAVEYYIEEINGLHEVDNEVKRFKKLENLSAEELYYLSVVAEEEIYTSSYLGVYKRMFERMTFADADKILRNVNYDYYRKFLKMAAGFNTLDDFLSKMDRDTSEVLMKRFVTGLDKKNSLEDAVDVADSYASINDPRIKKIILARVAEQESEYNNSANKRGATIYRLLNTIFSSIDTSTKINLTEQLNIPSVYNMPIKLLQDSVTGCIYIQMFFYGDKDGADNFSEFKSNFQGDVNWKVVNKPEWIEISSTHGTPIIIFANKPLDELKDLDRQAQDKLIGYLDSMNYSPTVTIHRGHSYYVKSTINQLPVSSKVILLGSCGGYNNLSDVLSFCPSAQIIASKQVGTGVVNSAIINLITEQLREGKDLNWPLLWKNLYASFKTPKDRSRFDDYVPPHKNLGAIFIMAYNKLYRSNSLGN